MQKKQLKDCPFCGKEGMLMMIPKHHISGGMYVVGCNEDFKCLCNINHINAVYVTEDEAIKAWNRRKQK